MSSLSFSAWLLQSWVFKCHWGFNQSLFNDLSGLLIVPRLNWILWPLYAFKISTTCVALILQQKVQPWLCLRHSFCGLLLRKTLLRTLPQWCWSLLTHHKCLSFRWSSKSIPAKQKFHFNIPNMLLITADSSIPYNQDYRINWIQDDKWPPKFYISFRNVTSEVSILCIPLNIVTFKGPTKQLNKNWILNDLFFYTKFRSPATIVPKTT